MARDSTQPLTTEEAKARLRAAAHEASLSTWMHHNPWGFIALALASGYLAGRLPVVRTSLMWGVARTMLALTHR